MRFTIGGSRLVAAQLMHTRAALTLLCRRPLLPHAAAALPTSSSIGQRCCPGFHPSTSLRCFWPFECVTASPTAAVDGVPKSQGAARGRPVLTLPPSAAVE